MTECIALTIRGKPMTLSNFGFGALPSHKANGVLNDLFVLD